MSSLRRMILVGAAVFGMNLLTAPFASAAAIIKIKAVQSCGVIGLDTSLATVVNGVHCDVGNTSFSLTNVLNGNIALLVGGSHTPSWNLINDTGVALSSLTLYFSGTLASNARIDMQVGNGIFLACTTTTANNIVNSSANCGSTDQTPYNPSLPVMMTWSGGTGLAINQQFNLGTASFAHSGADAGCISGTADCKPIPPPIPTPEPQTLPLLITGLVSMAGIARRLRRF